MLNTRVVHFATRFARAPSTRPLFQRASYVTMATHRTHNGVKQQFISVSKVGAFAAVSGAGYPLAFRQPVLCQGSTVVADPVPTVEVHPPRKLISGGDLTFGTVLGLCTGYFIQKVGKMLALLVGAGFVFLQYMSAKGFVTVHWDKIEAGYRRQMDVDKDGRVTVRDVRSRWQIFVNLLTKNIQFKSSFLAGLYVGIRYTG